MGFNHTAHIGPGGNPDFTLTLPSQYEDATYTANATVNGQQVSDHKTVTVFSATLTKSGSFSADDDTQNNLPALAPGETIHYNHNTNYNDGSHYAPTELKLKVQPAGLHLDLAPFDILQHFTVTATLTYNNGNPPESAIVKDQDDPTWLHTAGYYDASNLDGDTIYFMDGPGAGTHEGDHGDVNQVAAFEGYLTDDPTLQSVNFHYSLTVYPTYGGHDMQHVIGDVCNWTVDITLTKQPNGTVVWS